jgi:uncharacterized protein YbjT (DUF2867 family)
VRITVVGSTGGIGRALVGQALAAGHEVTAVVRESPRAADVIRAWEADRPGPAVAVVPALTAATLEPAVAGRDAVAIAVGPTGRTSGTDVNSQAARAVVGAMAATGVRRVVAVSAAPIGPDSGPAVYRRLFLPVLRRLVRDHYRDLADMEAVLAGSGLAWTVVRPPKLTDRRGSGRPEMVVDGPPPGVFVARADVAAAMLVALTDPATEGHAVGVST